MLHLFNKVYLDFDDKIEIAFDRVVISKQYGVPMHHELDKVAYGELMNYGKTYEDVMTESFVGFISSLKDHTNRTGKRIVIYCDKDAYKKLLSKWFKNILPSLTVEEFKNIVNYTIYNQRVTSNTQLSSVYSINLNTLWDNIGDVETYWEDATVMSPEETVAFKNLDLNYSYEFLMATYLSGSNSYKEKLRNTVLMFLRRWYKEMFADNRQMVLLNITNHKFQEALNIDPDLVDITRLDPLAGIPGLEAYSDDEIWERDETAYGVCALQNLDKSQARSLIKLFLKIFKDFEGIQTDQSCFEVAHWVEYTTQEKLTDEQLEEIVTYMVEKPFDTIGVPRFDFQNVNFPLMQYFLAKKFNGEDLSKYRLL